jgi:acyl-CoA thioesterase
MVSLFGEGLLPRICFLEIPRVSETFQRAGNGMDEKLRQAFHSGVEREPFATKFGLKLLEIGDGYSKVEMKFHPDMENLFGMAHGGALFALIDEAFETAANSHGTLAVALNMNVTFVASPRPGSILRAEAREVSLTRKTASYNIEIRDEPGDLIASCMALVYRKGQALPFNET